MKLLTELLPALPEFSQMLTALDQGKSPIAVSGLSSVHRAHITAGLFEQTGRPVALVCADEHEAERMAADLAAFSGGTVPVLTARAFTFHNAATVSRQWEHKRLALFHALLQGETALLVVTVEALLQRTIPPDEMVRASRRLKVGDVCDLSQLAEDLVVAGYTRGNQVEGVGQFALRGGILDLYPPGMEQPVRVEFFGDEVDAMGVFDPDTQRRTENVEEITILPAAEVLPQLTPGGLPALLKALERQQADSRDAGNEALCKTLRQDAEGLAQGRLLPAADRYLPLIYPKMATGADYLPPDCTILFSESSRIADRAKSYQWQMEEDVKLLLERGELCGACTRLCHSFSQLCARLEQWPVAYLDSFTLSAYPMPPRAVLSVMAKQLPSFGASLDTAVSDLQHYESSGYGTLVLVSGEQRALNLQTLLREHKVRSAVDFQLKALPQAGQVIICVGGLSAGLEYPQLRCAVLTEGQGAPVRKGPTPPKKR